MGLRNAMILAGLMGGYYWTNTVYQFKVEGLEHVRAMLFEQKRMF